MEQKFPKGTRHVHTNHNNLPGQHMYHTVGQEWKVIKQQAHVTFRHKIIFRHRQDKEWGCHVRRFLHQTSTGFSFNTHVRKYLIFPVAQAQTCTGVCLEIMMS